jgi:hypothetical protein
VSPFSGPYSAVVRQIKISKPGNTPGGYDPYTQLDLSVLLRTGMTVQGQTLHIVVGADTPVLESSNGSTAAPTSACDIRVGDQILLWAPIGFVDQTTPVPTPPVAVKLIIERGN